VTPARVTVRVPPLSQSLRVKDPWGSLGNASASISTAPEGNCSSRRKPKEWGLGQEDE
jgi:hypothetical protein